MTAEPFCFIDLDKNAIGQQIEGECEGDCGIQDFDVDLLEHLIVDDSQDEQDKTSVPIVNPFGWAYTWAIDRICANASGWSV